MAISRPLRAEIVLDYTRAGNTTDMPQNHWVMSSRVVFDAFGRTSPTKIRAIHSAEGQSLRLVASLDVELMTKDQDLSFQTRLATRTTRAATTRPCRKLLS